MEGKGEDVTLGEGNLKKMGRSSYGTELGDMAQGPEDPQVCLREPTGLVSKWQGLPTGSLGNLPAAK